MNNFYLGDHGDVGGYNSDYPKITSEESKKSLSFLTMGACALMSTMTVSSIALPIAGKNVSYTKNGFEFFRM